MRRLAIAAAVVIAWGAATGLLMPRGPLTTTQALASIAVSLLVGIAAGHLTRTKWAMPAAPAVFALATELARAGAGGPTVDAPHLSTFGVLAFLAGRGVHGLLALLPMAVGAAYGAGITRKLKGRIAITLPTAAVLLVAVGVAIPASTAKIEGGIAELTTIQSKDHHLGLMIRGAKPTNPVLLFVPGAPGAAERGAVRKHLQPLERDFVVATLDRRGGGTSYQAIEPTDTLTLENEVANTLAAANALRQKFKQDKVFLLAHSGGTVPAILAAQQHPELFHAYVGVGQAVDLTEADQGQYAEARLRGVGPPPYDHFYDYEPMLLAEAEKHAQPDQGGLMSSLAAKEYSLLDKAHVLAGLVDAYDLYYPRLRDLDLRTTVKALRVDVYFLDGANEVPSRSELMREWYANLQAPHKEHVIAAGTGHRSMFERPQELAKLLAKARTAAPRSSTEQPPPPTSGS
ncbi:alpha/beta fold hydrolase [Tenggerimyces flavus]|uniref:Alpha/beta fold hydrolase n=1 Tax=Tenggerimyces flavus TaxID=1708749 RepID=A0ABV7YFI2_9ACTN|nr:alpha/beta hydrolase [Tenggerimyces flavus]MBM7783884.1 pimeloyl-ACP methyl ester carboxylesterase [Tenggerimyces flavus]